MIKWNKATIGEREIISNIVSRLIQYGYRDNVPIDRLSAEMDITAAHINSKLSLQRLLESDEFNFKHDVYGILNHIDRNTGAMKDEFSPRHSMRREVTK